MTTNGTRVYIQRNRDKKTSRRRIFFKKKTLQGKSRNKYINKIKSSYINNRRNIVYNNITDARNIAYQSRANQVDWKALLKQRDKNTNKKKQSPRIPAQVKGSNIKFKNGSIGSIKWKKILLLNTIKNSSHKHLSGKTNKKYSADSSQSNNSSFFPAIASHNRGENITKYPQSLEKSGSLKKLEKTSADRNGFKEGSATTTPEIDESTGIGLTPDRTGQDEVMFVYHEVGKQKTNNENKYFGNGSLPGQANYYKGKKFITIKTNLKTKNYFTNVEEDDDEIESVKNDFAKTDNLLTNSVSDRREKPVDILIKNEPLKDLESVEDAHFAIQRQNIVPTAEQNEFITIDNSLLHRKSIKNSGVLINDLPNSVSSDDFTGTLQKAEVATPDVYFIPGADTPVQEYLHNERSINTSITNNSSIINNTNNTSDINNESFATTDNIINSLHPQESEQTFDQHQQHHQHQQHQHHHQHSHHFPNHRKSFSRITPDQVNQFPQNEHFSQNSIVDNLHSTSDGSGGNFHITGINYNDENYREYTGNYHGKPGHYHRNPGNYYVYHGSGYHGSGYHGGGYHGSGYHGSGYHYCNHSYFAQGM